MRTMNVGDLKKLEQLVDLTPINLTILTPEDLMGFKKYYCAFCMVRHKFIYNYIYNRVYCTTCFNMHQGPYLKDLKATVIDLKTRKRIK